MNFPAEPKRGSSGNIASGMTYRVCFSAGAREKNVGNKRPAMDFLEAPETAANRFPFGITIPGREE